MKNKWPNKAKAIRNLMQAAIARGDEQRVEELRLKLKEEIQNATNPN